MEAIVEQNLSLIKGDGSKVLKFAGLDDLNTRFTEVISSSRFDTWSP